VVCSTFGNVDPKPALFAPFFFQSVIISAVSFSLSFHMVCSRESAIEQCFSCMLLLGYRIVQILLGIRTCFVISSPLHSVIKTVVQKQETKRTLQTQHRGGWPSVIASMVQDVWQWLLTVYLQCHHLACCRRLASRIHCVSVTRKESAYQCHITVVHKL
jgi:hypothetical protein